MSDWNAFLERIATPLLAADASDWDRLEEHLAKDTSGHGKWWLDKMKEVRAIACPDLRDKED